ncbi:heme-binding protein [Pseudorhodoplanes sp.]|uniref:GlcG/HbpS family heme-binding protein n=1 Tax=Pseudorhodoplanes sp. TaxID=1934341 RepID=UPI002BC116CB|nr:heme-binding protein [Pseudorhodoplanes sp.]HWV55017.1 heme-binding protein [Pseudorhodoplanes sp.]
MRKKPCLQSFDVHKMAAACRAEAEKNNWSVTIAIVDDAGVLLYLDRMDGAIATTSEVATLKAKTSAITRRPSKFWEDRVKDRPAFMNFPGILQIQGGLPIMYEGECVGAIGVSGVQSHEDEQIAKAGIATLS